MPENKRAELDELVGKPPHWLVRWGITVFVFIIAIVAVIAWMVPYPETIALPVRLYHNGQVYARAYVPEKNVTTIKEGQQAITRLTAFPLHSAIIDGEVAFVDDSRTDSGYAITIIFPNGFAFRDRSPVSYKEGYTGTVTVITNRKSFLHKIIRSRK